MPKACIADRNPVRIELEEGEYFWCACGRSKNQPFCDGSHAGTGIEPTAFRVEQKCQKWICLCKQTEKAPFCDGSHKNIPSEEQ